MGAVVYQVKGVGEYQQLDLQPVLVASQDGNADEDLLAQKGDWVEEEVVLVSVQMDFID